VTLAAVAGALGAAWYACVSAALAGAGACAAAGGVNRASKAGSAMPFFLPPGSPGLARPVYVAPAVRVVTIADNQSVSVKGHAPRLLAAARRPAAKRDAWSADAKVEFSAPADPCCKPTGGQGTHGLGVPGLAARQQEVKASVANLDVVLRVQLDARHWLAVNRRIQRALHSHAVLAHDHHLPGACVTKHCLNNSWQAQHAAAVRAQRTPLKVVHDLCVVAADVHAVACSHAPGSELAGRAGHPALAVIGYRQRTEHDVQLSALRPAPNLNVVALAYELKVWAVQLAEAAALQARVVRQHRGHADSLQLANALESKNLCTVCLLHTGVQGSSKLRNSSSPKLPALCIGAPLLARPEPLALRKKASIVLFGVKCASVKVRGAYLAGCLLTCWRTRGHACTTLVCT